MKDKSRTREELMAELNQLRRKVESLESSVSEHIRSEKKMMDLNKQLQDLIDTSPVIIVRSDLTTKVTYVNKKFEEVTGYSPEEIVGRSWVGLGMVSGESVGMFKNRILEKLKGKPPDPMEVEIKRKDGRDVWLTGVGEIIRERGKPAGFQVIAQDITERKRAQDHYRLIAENSADVIYRLSIKDERFSYVSPSAERILGYTDTEALSMQPKDVLTTESYQKQLYEMSEDIKNNRSLRTLQLEAIHKNGHIVPVELNAHFVYDDKGEPVEIIGVVRDITERQLTEQERLESERRAQYASHMATIGEMAAGIAHEVSNPLSSVIGYSDWLLKQDVPGEIKEDLKVINNGAIRAGDILRRLLSFAGQRSTERDYMDINQIVEVAVSLLHHSLSNSNIEVIKQYDDSLPKIKVHEGQLQDVFINLIMNAEYSMLKAHNGGKLRIRTEKTDSSVRISFQDDGSGISKEDIGSLFKPFFTTKPIGKGTGLGLSVCYGTITAHGGDIYVESEPGKGATFCIELPFPS